MASFLELIRETVLTKYSIVLNTWSDINPQIYGKVALELNNCLQDTWLNFNYDYRKREINMTCVAGQYNYDLPAAGFTGKIKQDGLMIQPVSYNMLGQPARYVTLKYNENSEEFFADGLPGFIANNIGLSTTMGLPRDYTVYNNQVLLKPIPDKPYKMICLYYCRNWALSNASVATPTGTQNKSGQKILAVDHTQDVDMYGNTQSVFQVGDVVYIDNNTSIVETGVIQSIDTVNNLLTFVGNLTFTHSAGARVSVERQIMQFASDTPNCDISFHNTFVAGALSVLFFGDVRQSIYIDKFSERVSNMINESRNTQEGQQCIKITRQTW